MASVDKDTLVMTVKHALGLNTNKRALPYEQEDEVEIRAVCEKLKKYDRFYDKPKILPEYNKFGSFGIQGIPRLVEYFQSFDPVNAVGCFGKWTNYLSANEAELNHLQMYLQAPEFNRGLLQDTRYDHVVNAIISYVLHWDGVSLSKFKLLYPKYESFIDVIVDEKRRHQPLESKRVPFIRCSMKLLKVYFGKRSDGDLERPIENKQQSRRLFNLNECVPTNLRRHFQSVYSQLLSERCELNTIEQCMESPFGDLAAEYIGSHALRLDLGSKKANSDENIQPFKVITGQSCCGKTTLLNKLSKDGWSVCSRSDLGTYSGKSNSAPTIATLHFAIENALRRGDVIGDRGPIDNPLWVGIMHLCYPKNETVLVDEILSYLSSHINEHSLAYLCNQQTIVFIDPFPSRNRKRMLARCKGGDCFRARIRMYPIVQAMSYYITARLFGWHIFCVPYNHEGSIDARKFDEITEQCKKIFGKPIKNEKPLPPSSRIIGGYDVDNDYALATGIFK